MAQKVSGTGVAAGVTQQTVPANTGASGRVMFRKATRRKVELASQDAVVFTAGMQPMTRVLEGTGYLEGVDIRVSCVTALNVAAVAYNPDAPFNAIQNYAFKAIGPDIQNLDGYSLYLLNLYGGYGFPDPATSLDPLIFQQIAGAVGNGGTFNFTLRAPLSISDRNLIGIMGNQDQGTKYQLTTDIAPDATVYAVLPTAPGTVTIERFLNYCSIPASVDANGVPQEQVPPAYGVLHMANVLVSEAAPTTASTRNHFLRSLGNTDRVFILVFRTAAGARTDLMLPTQLTFFVGSDVWFSETSAERRHIMRKRYNIDAPAGVLVYDFVQDFVERAGFELGDDWFNSTNVPQAYFTCVYPAFAGGPGTLQIITDQLVIPPAVNIAAAV